MAARQPSKKTNYVFVFCNRDCNHDCQQFVSDKSRYYDSFGHSCRNLNFISISFGQSS